MTPERQRLVLETLGRPARATVYVDDGYDFEVVIVDGEWVFRFPRRAQVVPALEQEVALLPRLAPALPVAVPRFEHLGTRPPFVAYRLLVGEPLADGVRPDVVARFLAALHRFDPMDIPVEREPWQEAYARQCAEFERLVVPLLEPHERERAARFFAAGVASLEGFTPALVHADLGPEHLLCSNGDLVAVIDWGDARVGDSALDFAWLLFGPTPAFAERLLDLYGGPPDDGFRERALFYHRLVPWYEAHYGLFVGRAESVGRGTAEIRARLP